MIVLTKKYSFDPVQAPFDLIDDVLNAFEKVWINRDELDS